jgi:hypothetical protein
MVDLDLGTPDYGLHAVVMISGIICHEVAGPHCSLSEAFLDVAVGLRGWPFCCIFGSVCTCELLLRVKQLSRPSFNVVS